MVRTVSLIGCHKLNVDASGIDRNNSGMICGVIRGDKCKIEIAFARSVGDVTILRTECMATCERIRLARKSKI